MSKIKCYLWGCQNKEVPIDLEHVFSILSLSDQPEVVGSFSYPGKHHYPGDIDVFQQFDLKVNDKIEAATVYARFFKILARRIDLNNRDDASEPVALRSRQIYLTDFKAGMYFDEEGNKEKLRWTLNEMASGIAIRHGIEYRLIDALMEKTLVKIDTVVNFRGRLVGLEIVYHLFYNGKELSTIGDEPYIEKVSADYLKYSDPNSDNYRPLKAIKRLWIVSILSNNPHLANHLANIFSSSVAALHQIKETAATIDLVLEKSKHPSQTLASAAGNIATNLIVDNAMWMGRSLSIHDPSLFVKIDPYLDQLWNAYNQGPLKGLNGENDGVVLQILVPLLKIVQDEISVIENAESQKLIDETRDVAMSIIQQDGQSVTDHQNSNRVILKSEVNGYVCKGGSCVKGKWNKTFYDGVDRDESERGNGRILVPGFKTESSLT